MAAEWCWPWLSSGTACFLFFNVIVGAVAVLSWRQGGDAPVSKRRRLTRSASSMVMERLRSMSFFHYVPDHSSLTPPASQEEEGEETGRVVEQPEPAMPVGESLTPSMAPSTPNAPGAAAAAELRSVASTSGSDKAEAAETRTELSRCLGDACALVGRQRGGPALEPTTAMERPRKREPAKVAEIVGRRAYAEMDEKAEVNARADRFIRQFREDRKLERIKSILNNGRAAAAMAR